jgi:2-polyprenyl-3-methyl-5-hydroxy-6-metoxy-1,4-benzoquinol methylase
MPRLWPALFLAIAVGCKPTTKSESSSAKAAPSAQVHDPTHPPIDCPLKNQHIDPAKLRPFEDIDKYIAFLERPDRAAWQKPDEVVAALGLSGRETVADLGAGSGYFTFPIARALPQGKVIAIDIEPEMIRHVHHKVMTEGIPNVRSAFGKNDDPSVPADADVVFMCDVLHHVADRPAWMGKLASEMKPGARLAVIEFKEGDLPQGPPKSAKIARAEIVALAAGAGLPLVDEKPELLPYQTFLVFRKRP